MFLNFNGEVRDGATELVRTDNRGFRYGDGLFETMLVRGGQVRLGKYHLERLSEGMRLLHLEIPGPFSLDLLEKQIGELLTCNRLHGDCRARLTVFRRGWGVYNALDRMADYCIHVGALPETEWSREGLTLGVFSDGRRACDAFSGIKSNNYLLSSQAGIFAAEQGLDDCLLLNSYGRVAETAAANVWWVKGGRIYTPPLSEGCVAGVMRRWLLEALPAAGFIVREKQIGPEALAGVDEIFISNAIRGIQWVRECRHLNGRALRSDSASGLVCRVATTIHQEVIQKM